MTVFTQFDVSYLTMQTPAFRISRNAGFKWYAYAAFDGELFTLSGVTLSALFMVSRE